MRCQEPGWEEIGKTCSAGRRSLWLRVNYTPEAIADADERLAKTGIGAIYVTEAIVTSIELCAGREGDDDYVRIDRTNPQFGELLAIFLTARFAATT